MRKGRDGEKKREKRGGKEGKTTTSLPAVHRPNADCWNAARSCQKTKVESVQFGCLLKSPIFVIQKVATPKNGVEFAGKPLLSSYLVFLCHMMTGKVLCLALNFHQSE